MAFSKLARFVGIGVAVIAVGLVLLGTSWPWIVPRLIYHPRNLAEDQHSPQDFGYAGEQTRFRTADGEVLHGWHLSSSADQKRGCIVLFAHGNAGNITNHAGFMRPFLAEGFDAFLFDYRGYGVSTGRPSEDGLYMDVLAAFDHLVASDRPGNRHVMIASHSLGSAVATYLATHRDVAGVIVAAPFTSFPDAMQTHASWVPVDLLRWEKERFDSRSRIGRISVPIMVVAGADDRLVPSSLSRRLYESASQPKHWVEVPGGHNEVFWSDEFARALDSFADRIPKCVAQ